MKFIALFLALILSVEGANLSLALRKLQEQKFIKTGTGLEGVPVQSQIPDMKSGCCFLSACVVGGLGTVKRFIEARKWALQTGKIRSDNYVNMDKYVLAQQISKRFKTVFHDKWKIVHGKNHFYVVNERNVEVFNSAGLGYGH